MSIKGDARNMGAAQRPAFIQCYNLRFCVIALLSMTEFTCLLIALAFDHI